MGGALTRRFALAAAFAAAGAFAGALPNGGFEALDRNGWADGWMHYGPNAWRLDSHNAHSGTNSFLFDITDRSIPAYGRCAGVRRYIDFKEHTKDPIYFGAWSKAQDVYCGRDYECCLSVGYADDTWDWSLPGLSIKFRPGTHGWELGHSVVYPRKPVKKVVFYAFIRKGYGKAWFDDLFLERRDPGPIHLGCRRMTDRPYADSEKMVVAVPDREIAWTSVATGGLSGSGKGRRFLEVPVPREACSVKLTLSGGGRTNTYDISLAASALRDPYLEPNDVCVWTADSLRKVTPLTWPTGEELARPHMRMDVARGGVASAQLLVTSGRNASRKSADVTLGTLRNSTGAALKGSLKWERVGYVERQFDTIPHPMSPPAEERFIPDPLLPAAPFRLRAGATQGAWLTVAAAHDAEPGVYRASATLTTSGGERFEVPVEVEVWSFALPHTFGMETSFANMAAFTRRFFPKDARRMDRAIQDIMLDHRLNADNMSRWDVPDIEDVRHAVRRGANRFNVLALLLPPKDPNALFALWPDSKVVVEPDYMRHLETTLTPFVERLRREGLMKYAYLYGFDERNQEHYAGIDATWRRLKELYPDLPVLTTARMYKDMALSKEGTNFPHAVTTDWYCPLTSVWKQELTDQLHALGKKVWWYTCCGPLYPYANFASLEEPWAEARVLAWQQYMVQADGLLFWSVNWWRNVKRLDAGDTLQRGLRIWSDLNVQGDGVLVYPGEDAVYPSIRLAAIRDAVQDHEWLKLAEERHSRAACERLCQKFIRSLDDFDRDGDALLKTRRALGELIRQLR